MGSFSRSPAPVGPKTPQIIELALERLAQARPRLVWVGSRDNRIFHRSGATGPTNALWLERLPDTALKALYGRALCLVFPRSTKGSASERMCSGPGLRRKMKMAGSSRAATFAWAESGRRILK